MSRPSRHDTPWSATVDEVLQRLEADPGNGLGTEEIRERRDRFGLNRLREVEQESLLAILIRQFKSLIMLVLAMASGLSLLFGRWADALAILVAMLINAGIGFFTELKALRSMEALQRMDKRSADVIREGDRKEVDAEELVPGDIVVLEGGDMVMADLRVLEANSLQVDESALTGESVPVAKDVEAVEEDTPLADRSSMLFKGTAVTRGSGMGVVTGTGMDTELGGITSLIQEAQAEDDPLTRRLDRLASLLVKVILVVAAVAGAAGLLAGKELYFMAETAVALFVAAVPEGLPIVATLALARGMHRMARRNALVRRLSAVQTLGATNVILTDKTGTLTENLMTATTLRLLDDTVTVKGTGYETSGDFSLNGEDDPLSLEGVEEAVRVGVLCNNASLGDEDPTGDPTEVALLVLGAKAGFRRKELLAEREEVREVSFDPDTKMMATIHRDDGEYLQAVKGAPDAVLSVSSQVLTRDGPRPLEDRDREFWEEENRRLAGEGMRVLALARGTAQDPEEDPYQHLEFLALVGLRDPVREEVREPLARFRQAGIHLVMVTGDQEETAVAVARELDLLGEEEGGRSGDEIPEEYRREDGEHSGLLEESVFYRVTPEQKLNLISIHQQAGSIVGMTGDGVNDAPALKKADIGIAMGKRGEQVAEDAADIILQDDRFASVALAVEQGRIIFQNIRSFVVYMISGNAGEILLVSLAALAGAPLPLLPLQILYINAVNDIFPALALGVGPGSGREMDQPPRDPDEPILTRSHWYAMGIYGAIIGLPVLGTFALALTLWGMPTEQAVTISFLSVAFARLWHVFNMRDKESGIFINQITTNPLIWGALGLCLLLLLLAVFLPPLAEILGVVSPGLHGWLAILGTSLVPLILGQILKALKWV
jgi:P-type Ca2+ transporter type 2C